jgi:hypothetical protein
MRIHFVLPTQIQALNISHGKYWEEVGGWYGTSSFNIIICNAHKLARSRWLVIEV